MKYLEVACLSRSGGDGAVLRDISLTIDQFQKVAVAGETGSGKSTLLKIIAGLDQADEGSVHFEGERVPGSAEKLVPGHDSIAYLSQHFELPKFLRVEQVLSYAETLSDEESSRLYQICEIDHLMNRKTDQLSGGERQRIALARTLVRKPSVLLLDEPFSNLDVIHKNTLKKVLDEVAIAFGLTLVLVSHDPADTLAWADSILVLRNGKVSQEGPPSMIYSQPKDDYVAGLFGKYNKISAAFKTALGCKERREIFRPEEFVLDQPSSSSLPARVKETRFFGSYYELIVETEHGSTIVYISSMKGISDEGLHLHLRPRQSV